MEPTWQHTTVLLNEAVLALVTKPDGKARILDPPGFRHRLRVLVEGHQPAGRGQPGQDRAGVSAAPEGRIHVSAGRRPGLREEGFHRFLQQDGGMGPWLFHCAPQNEKSWKTSGIWPCVASASFAS